MIKWIFRFAFILVVLVIAGLVFLSFNLNRVVKGAVETYGPQISKTSVDVDSVVLLPLSGKGRISGLAVGNPPGFKTPSAIRVRGASVSIDTGSVMKDKIVIRSIHVRDPEITLEGKLKDNNLTKILANVQSSTRSSSRAAKDAEDSGAAKKLQIDSVSITGAKVSLAIPGLKGQTASVPLSDITLTNLGQGPKGITAAEVSSQILVQILAQTSFAIPKILAGDALEGLDIGAELSKRAGKLGLPFGKTDADADTDAQTNQTEDGEKKSAEKIGEAVGGFLKGLKKED